MRIERRFSRESFSGIRRLLAEEIKAKQLKESEELQRKYDEEQQRQSNCRLPCIRTIDLPSSNKKLIFARYNHWIMIPWFCISALFDPALSENTIERFVSLLCSIEIHSFILIFLGIALQILSNLYHTINQRRSLRAS